MLIIGVGNDFRQDDALGLLVARALAETNLPGARVVESTGDGTQLLELFASNRNVILIDAMESGAEPGTIQRFDVDVKPLPLHYQSHSTHVISVAQAIELARQLGCLPPRLIVYGIEGIEFGFGDGLSPTLDNVIDSIIAQITELVQAIDENNLTMPA